VLQTITLDFPSPPGFATPAIAIAIPVLHGLTWQPDLHPPLA
jgi:hypothetical protein